MTKVDQTRVTKPNFGFKAKPLEPFAVVVGNGVVVLEDCVTVSDGPVAVALTYAASSANPSHIHLSKWGISHTQGNRSKDGGEIRTETVGRHVGGGCRSQETGGIADELAGVLEGQNGWLTHAREEGRPCRVVRAR